MVATEQRRGRVQKSLPSAPVHPPRWTPELQAARPFLLVQSLHTALGFWRGGGHLFYSAGSLLTDGGELGRSSPCFLWSGAASRNQARLTWDMMDKQKGLQVWSRLKHRSYTEAWAPSFFPGPGCESKQGPSSYSISDPQPPEAASRWLFRLLIRTAATGTQGMTGSRTTGE